MDSTQVLCTVVGLVCAVASGYIFGGDVPSWEDDYANDPLPGEMSTNAASYGWGGTGYDMAWLDGCLSTLFRIGKLGATVLAIAAIVLVYGYSGLGSAIPSDSEGGDFLVWFDIRSWLLLGSAGLGYLVAILTDRGPVGPLR